ncbi:MAG: AraC family transcriptional regulator, partial [Cytophagales bacterium]|nr:AraC family transcriptional regulator [Armatimonadota bacterium]
MDVLTEVLNTVRIRSTVHCPTEATGAFGLSIAEKDGAKFCLVLKGHCWVEVEGQKAVRLEEGDLAIVTRSMAHTIRTSLNSPILRLEAFLASHPRSPDGMVRYGSEGEKTVIIGGCFYFEDFQTSPLLRALPVIFHITSEQGRAFGMEATIQAILSESLSGRPGAETVLTRLSDILFIQALRAYLTHLPECGANWFRAALDPQIGEALTAIHRDPSQEWRVSTLASYAAMSRSAFAARFTQLVGEPPLHYVTRWRLHKAARHLCEKNDSVAQVAALSGYQSEAAFSKVFKQWMGQTPTAFRR